ncbi:MAG: DnaJ domain-containing protein [Chthoniobacterales bacterium]
MKQLPSDPFALLGIPRRPVVNLDLLEKNVRVLASKHHPDHVTGAESIFEKIQEAATLLRDPASRLRFLAGEVTPEKSIPAFAEELFSIIANALTQAEEKRVAYQVASGALAKALLTKDLLKARTTLVTTQESLHVWKHSLDQELQAIDLRWPSVDAQELFSLANGFLFAQRWDTQLREALFQSDVIH